MRIAWFVPTFGLFVVLGLAGLGAGCGRGSAPLSEEDSEKLRVSRKGAHVELKEGLKAQAQKIQEERQQQSGKRKGARRGQAAR
jgi:hypothetical protein